MVQRLIAVVKWLVIAGLVLLAVVGVVTWAAGSAGTGTTVTPTPLATQVVASPVAETPLPTVVPPTWTPTPSPTLTPTSTPTRRPTATPTATATPTPTAQPEDIALPPRSTLPPVAGTAIVSSTLPQPEPMPLVEQPAGTVNILLLGMDRLAGQGVARTDVMVIASIFPDVPAASLLSIPRDYYAWIPGWGLDKINTAYLRANRVGYPGGGPALAKATVEYNFGVPIHYYALVDFSSYRTIIDAVDGVDIIVECPFHDTYPDVESATDQTDIDMEPGLHHLDGKHALWYVRSRWNTSDFDRHRRQQQVLMAILSRARSADMLLRVPDLWGTYRESVETDLNLSQITTLASVGVRLDTRDIHNSFIRGTGVLTGWTAPNGGAVLVPNLDAVQALVQGAMRPLASSRASQRAYRVAVSNGTWSQSLGDVAAYRLGLEGFVVTTVTPVDPTPRTQIIDYTTTSKGSPLWKLLSMYRLQVGDVVAQPTEGSDIDFQVVLGADYNPCTATNTVNWRPTPTPSPTPTTAPDEGTP